MHLLATLEHDHRLHMIVIAPIPVCHCPLHLPTSIHAHLGHHRNCHQKGKVAPIHYCKLLCVPGQHVVPASHLNDVEQTKVVL